MYSSKWFNVEVPNPNAAIRVFCFPYAGGGASVFRKWYEGLPTKVEVVSVCFPGRERRFNEMPVGSLPLLVESLYQNITPFLDKPFVFFGHSNGALICYELALLLNSNQCRMLPEMLIVSAKCPPHIPSDKKAISALPDDQFIAELIELNGTPKELLQNREMMELLLPTLRADFSLGEGKIFRKKKILDCPVRVFYGVDDVIPLQQIIAWQDLFSEPVGFHEFPGGHFFIHDKRTELLSALSGVLSEMKSAKVD